MVFNDKLFVIFSVTNAIYSNDNTILLSHFSPTALLLTKYLYIIFEYVTCVRVTQV